MAFTRRTFVDKVMSLLFKMLSRLIITFLPRKKRLLISWLQSPSAVILEPRKRKSATVSPSIWYIMVFICLCLAVLGLHCWAGSSLAMAGRGYSLVVVDRLLSLWSTGSRALGLQ